MVLALHPTIGIYLGENFSGIQQKLSGERLMKQQMISIFTLTYLT